MVQQGSNLSSNQSAVRHELGLVHCVRIPSKTCFHSACSQLGRSLQNGLTPTAT
jgi:hypothetical protein